MAQNVNWKGKAAPLAGFQLSKEPLLGGADPYGQEETATKFASGTPSDSGASAESGELPWSYNAGEVFLIAQEPHRLFTYWDIDVRLHPGGPAVLRCLRGPTNELEVEIEVPFECRNWYIPVKSANTSYAVEIGYYRNDQWYPLGKSGIVWTPPDTISTDTSFQFSTLPNVSALASLLATVPDSMRKNLDNNLRKLLDWQLAGGKLPKDLLPDAGTAEALLLLKEILGASLITELIAGGVGDSEALSSRISARLVEVLSSEASRGMLARFLEAASESSLFSGIFSSEFLGGRELSSEMLSSLSSAAVASSELLSSYSSTAGEASELLSSFASSVMSSSVAFGSEQLASWTRALLSWAAAARTAAASEWLASWGVVGIGETSWGMLPTSWGGALAASWERALSSWTGKSLSSFESAQSFSWFQAVLSSWLHQQAASWFSAQASSWGAEYLSSWMRENLSSAGLPESGSWAVPAVPRSFYMHVNAEVIFYGGTHPEAKVTINGQPVTLDANGNFYFHFVFPDGSYQIPIIAVSPDGQETRRAILRFERVTQKTGEVGDTMQPPLPTPMGALS
jgi:hypothetical protein